MRARVRACMCVRACVLGWFCSQGTKMGGEVWEEVPSESGGLRWGLVLFNGEGAQRCWDWIHDL